MAPLQRICIAALVALLGATTLLEESVSAARPNIVIVLTDDQRADATDHMETVHDRLARYGVTFENAFVSNSLCCPSRTTLLTGRYSHGTGVWSNRRPFGGWATFRKLGAERRTIAVALRAAGYRTSFVGKYLNGYVGKTIPPGWDEWRSFSYGWGYFGYTLNLNGKLMRYGRSPKDYSTDVLARLASDFIRRSATSSRPFLLFFAPAAPHSPATPAPRHAHIHLGLEPFWSPSFGEDISDKPRYMQRSPQDFTQSGQDFRVHQYRSLLAVDEAVDRLLNALRDTGKLHNTVVVFTSDNGVEWGEHGFPAARKSVPHEASIRVPLVVRYDPLTRSRRTDRHLVTNLDIAPTLASLAGIRFGAQGLSLAPLLKGRPNAAWRKQFLVENMGGETAAAGIPTYCGVRTERFLYALYATGEHELYDLDADPYQLANLAGDRSSRPARRLLLRRVRRLCYPLPPGFHPGALCTLQGTTGNDDLNGTTRGDFVCLRGGRDRVATGSGADTVNAAAATTSALAKVVFSPRGKGPLGSSISTGAGADRILALNGRRDVIRCGSGRDDVSADRFDRVSRDCERVRRPGR